MKFQDMARTFRKKQDDILEDDGPNSPKMDDDVKKRLQEMVDKK